jgi:hypothetical protein
MNTEEQPDNLPKLILLTLTAIGGIYIFVVNYIFQPASWREWFAQHVSPELAVLNLVGLVALSFSVTLYGRYFPLSIRLLLMLGIILLGSFLRSSIESAPSTGVPIILVAVVLYIILHQKRQKL